MEAVAYSTFRNNLKSYMKRTRDDADTLLVTNTDPEDNVVVMNVRDYNSLIETMRIYNNPYLKEKLDRSIAQLSSGRGATHDLLEADDE